MCVGGRGGDEGVVSNVYACVCVHVLCVHVYAFVCMCRVVCVACMCHLINLLWCS